MQKSNKLDYKIFQYIFIFPKIMLNCEVTGHFLLMLVKFKKLFLLQMSSSEKPTATKTSEF